MASEPPRKDVNVRRQVDFRCPCGGKGSAGYVDHKDGERDVPAVFHSLPYRDAFDRLDGVAYLQYVRGVS